MANLRSTSLIHIGWLTTDYPYQQASHDLFPSVEGAEGRFSFLFLFFSSKICWHSFIKQSHITTTHSRTQVHLPPFWNRLPRSPLWNCVNSIVQPLSSISLIQPRWSTWGTRVNVPLDKSNETPTWCNTVHVLFLQGHSKCFGQFWPSLGATCYIFCTVWQIY